MKYPVGFIALLLLFSCNGKKENPNTENLPVTVIFIDAPHQSSREGILWGKLSLSPAYTVRYVDEAGNTIDYIPRSIGNDTLSLPVHDGFADIVHLYQVNEAMAFAFLAGDTVRITYDERQRPWPESTVSKKNTRLYRLPYALGEAIGQENYHNLSVLNNDDFITAYWGVKGIDRRQIPESIMARMAEVYIDLDSVETVYDQYRDHFRSELDRIKQAGGIPENLHTYYSGLIDYQRFERDDARRKRTDREEIIYSDRTVLPLLDDGRSHWMIYRTFAGKYGNALRFTDTLAVGFDPAQGFERIAYHPDIPPLTRRFLLQNSFSAFDLHPDIPIDREKYRAVYEAVTGESLPEIHVAKKENLRTDASEDMILTDLAGRSFSQQEMWQRFRGKVVYVDFWASWCGPCIAAMPAALKLREEYREKDVVFLYLAVNDRMDAWRGAVAQNRTDYLGENVFIENRDSKFLQYIQLTSIPRLLIFDRNGELREMDAPRPESDRIRQTLDRYLSLE